MHSVERAESDGLQEQLLRKHDLLRGLQEKHGASITTVHAARCGQTASAWTGRNFSSRLAHSAIRSRPNCLRKRAGPRAFAASSRGDLHSSHLIQRR